LLWEGGLVAKKRTYEELKKRVIELEEETIKRKRAYELLQRHMAKLERSNTNLRRSVHMASHDLQGSLDEVMRYLRFVEARYKDRLDSDAKAFIASAVEGATRMQRIIKDLMTYSDRSRRERES
jgi:light-regulated signal transduction histidine kinase (bacteriophytochrome)